MDHLRFGPPVLLVVALWATGTSAQSPALPDIDYRVIHISPIAGGVYPHAADEWSMLTVRLTNRRDQPVALLCTTYFDTEPTRQYGRRVWLPARSRMRTRYPVRIPPLADPEQEELAIHTVVSEVDGRGEVRVRDDSGKMQLGGVLQVSDAPVTGIVSPLKGPPGQQHAPLEAKDLAVTAQLDLGIPHSVTTIGDRLLPASREGLGPFGQLILADDRMLADVASLSALRHWLFDGGRLWVMLDRVDPALLEALLGDTCGCHVVDTVTLNDVEIAQAPPGSPSGGGDIEPASGEYEQPVKLVRVLLDEQVDVPFEVNGWPAAFELDYGAGLLLVTTLESTAWVRPGRPQANSFRRAGPPRPASRFTSTPAFKRLMGRFYEPRPEHAAPIAEILEPEVSRYVGYSISSRGVVLGLLGGFVVALAGTATLLLRSGRLEQLAIVAPVLAVLAAGTLIAAGRRQQQTVPPTMALLQRVQPMPGTDDVLIEGAAGLYAQDAGTLHLAGHRGGWMVPDLSGTEGTTRRLIHSDIDQWAWENVPQSPGLRTAEFHLPLRQPQRTVARAEVGPQGITGRLSLPEGLQADDAIVATGSGRVGVELHEDGTFTARSDRVLGADQYLGADLLDDEQIRRSRLLASVLEQDQTVRDGSARLYFWTPPREGGVETADDIRRVGAALWSLPLELERPAPGTEVWLPSPLLPYRGTIGPDGLRPSGLYDHRRNEWTRKIWPSSTWLRFQLPEGLLPLELTSAGITVRVTGPVRRLTLSIARDEQVIPVKSWGDPVGTLTLELDGEELPRVTGDGGLLLRIDGGDPDLSPGVPSDADGIGEVSYWQIESLDMEVRAVVQKPGDEIETD